MVSNHSSNYCCWAMALGYVVYILGEAFEELADGSYDTTKQESPATTSE